MTTQARRAAPVLEFSRMQHGTFGLRITLILFVWLSLFLATVFSAGTGAIGTVWAAILFPVFGFFFGGIGMRGARDKAAKTGGTELLPADHWVTQETYRLADKLGLPAYPWVATMPVNNAYAIGARPDNAMVVVGKPLLEQLSREEISAIIGHELGHIANNDMRRMAIAENFQRALTWYLGFSDTLQATGRWALNWMAELWVLGLSRKREYWADAVGAALTNTGAMKSALVKIHQAPGELTAYESRNARLMFRGKGAAMFSTHPTLEQRLAALDSGDHLRRLPHLKATGANDLLTAPAPANSDRPLPSAGEIAWSKDPRKSA